MLTIYRASAGAGKTHKLTGEYLMLLFSQPGAYRRILAVTFTNKATDEMKTRIVQELYHLASGRASDYIQLLSSAYSLTERQVREQARKIFRQARWRSGLRFRQTRSVKSDQSRHMAS